MNSSQHRMVLTYGPCCYLYRYEHPSAARLNPGDIIATVLEDLRISQTEFFSGRRDNHTAFARHMVCYLIREMTGLSYPEIGICIGRDHSTIIHGYQTVRHRMATFPEFRYTVDRLRQKVEGLGR